MLTHGLGSFARYSCVAAAPSVSSSERFFEVNFCSEVSYEWHPCRLTWFTPSQNQEADLAFDTYTNMGGRFFFFQFKFARVWRERRTLCTHKHRYLQAHADHDQMTVLRDLASGWPPETVLYAMPGFLEEIPPRVAPVTHLWDVLHAPAGLPAPTTPHGGPRKSGEHQLNLCPECGVWQLRSEPAEVPGLRASAFINEMKDQLRSMRRIDIQDQPAQGAPTRVQFDTLTQSLDRRARGVLVAPAE